MIGPKIAARPFDFRPACDQRQGFATNAAGRCRQRPIFARKEPMPTLRERVARSRYFYHYLFWAIVLLSYFVDAAALLDLDRGAFFRTMVLKNGLLIGIVYVHLRVLMPRLL